MTVGREYQLISMRKTTTRFGPALVVLLVDEDGQFEAFLPARYESVFSAEDLKTCKFSELRLVYDGSVRIINK